MRIIVCNSSASAPDTINYLITRQGDIQPQHPHDTYNIYVALDNWGPVIRDGNSWIAAHRVLGEMRPVEPQQKITVPYEFCTKQPWRDWVYYEYYPQRQLNALHTLYTQLHTQYPTLHIYPIYAINPRRTDPQPQIELKRLLQMLRHENATI